MRLQVRHETRYQYEGDAFGASIRLRLLPITSPTQTVNDWCVTVNEEPVSSFVPNGLGVPEMVWRTAQRLSEVSIVAQGSVDTFDNAGMVGSVNDCVDPRVFLRHSDFTAPNDAIRALAQSVRSPDGDLATLHALCQAVHETLDYRPETTDSATTAADALALGAGVCQDFAHLFIASAQVLDIPARYVAGYLFDPESPDIIRHSHGWAESYVERLGWIGFDPTHKICMTDHYVRLCWGLDAFDAAPLRGVAHVSGAIGMEVDVSVGTEEPGDLSSQQ